MKTHSEFFFGADLRACHDGLTKLAAENGVHIGNLKRGESVFFINSKKNRVKALSWNKVMSYLNLEPEGRFVDVDALYELARAFNPNGTFNYKTALKATIEKKLEKTSFGRLEIL